ncbi:MAG: thioesterase family protein [Bacteroidales bacterium]|nr:thioesterase family protein [Bacteroidales bacterium]
MQESSFTPGLAFTSSLSVSQEDTALAMGSGTLPVLATPRLAALMENAAMNAVAPILEPGDTTVGGEISVRHLAPTPLGAEVSATATLEKTEGRKLTFSIEARQGDILIGTATHTRFIVNSGRFMGKLS